jgi:hypothetical protein
VARASKKQHVVAIFSTEFEYVALSKIVSKAIWLRRQLEDLGFVQKNLTAFFGDNQNYFALASNPKFHDRSKHI